MLEHLLDIVFEPVCELCGRNTPGSRHHICPACISRIRVNTPPFCVLCGRHVGRDNMACPDCRGAASPFSKIWSWAIYDDRLKKYLHLFKYHGLSDALAALREDIVLFTLKHTDIKECSVIVPVPIHEARHEKRGFNQAAKIASLLSSYYGIPASSLLVKIRDTPPQHSLSRAERAKNVKDAFKPVYKNSLRGKSVLLVDDILTTGATMRECARELKKNGAKKVYGFTLSSAL